ncbi:predicted protein [Naegleria gruberi]|uniref:Predicted protein n=1 Tax=Naegleria gruberi TaxID=5762 RepID=D2V6R5_NAEGR|nr:uncharacterized protein NAEGRDRAFT_64534 [Naegleria gruberi]EFC47486.1 predicted protein [Naegleria gruberi]|eukprot:XP_002680230.1 predicted protein [Naegleria gruberi strain NEG-M]
MTLPNHHLQHQKVYPIEITNETTPSASDSTTTSNEISSKAIDKVNRKAFVIDDFDKSMELKNVDESLDDFSWVPKSPLTSNSTYRPKSARNRYDQAFRIENDLQVSPNSNQQASYYKQAAFNHILNNSTNVNNNNETTQKNDEKSVAKTKPKSAPPHIKRNTSDNNSERKNPFAIIKGLLNMCKTKNHVVEHDETKENIKPSSAKSKHSETCQNITIEKTQVVVFDNRANREELPPSPQMNRRAKCGGYGDDDSNRDQPIIVPLYYHVMNAGNNPQSSEAPKSNNPNTNVLDLSDSVSDIQEF